MASEVGPQLGTGGLLLGTVPPRRQTPGPALMTQLSFLDEVDQAACAWAPTRQAGLERLETFLPRAGRAYASGRNFDHGSSQRDNVSALSPWVRHRAIVETEILSAVIGAHGFKSARKFIQEVFWRAYFKGWLEHNPVVWDRYRNAVATLVETLSDDVDLHSRWQTATEGRTGIDCFDAWANELVETGYLHNHTRMWFASIWIFTLGLPWQLGADFFYRHLLDGDPASNTLSWRWVAGLHTKGKTYLARASNIARYTQGRFNPEGQLAEQAEALTEPPTGASKPLIQLERLPADEPFGLLITEEDCHPESLDLPAAPRSLAGMTATENRSPLATSKSAVGFTNGLIRDALDRGEHRYGCGSTLLDEDNADGTITGWARTEGLRHHCNALCAYWSSCGRPDSSSQASRPP